MQINNGNKIYDTIIVGGGAGEGVLASYGIIEYSTQRLKQEKIMSDKSQEINQNKEIDIDNATEVKEWSEYFGVEEGSLIAAVKFVGTSSQKVKKFLGK